MVKDPTRPIARIPVANGRRNDAIEAYVLIVAAYVTIESLPAATNGNAVLATTAHDVETAHDVATAHATANADAWLGNDGADVERPTAVNAYDVERPTAVNAYDAGNAVTANEHDETNVARLIRTWIA